MQPLYQLVAQYKSLETLDASDDLPEAVIRDTLEALEGEVTEKCTNVAKAVLNWEALADAIEAAAKKMRERAGTIRRRSDSIRRYLHENMQRADITKIESPEFVLAIRKNPPSVMIDDDAAIPPELRTEPEPPPPTRPDKKLIAAQLKAGLPVPGAHLEQSTRLDIR